MILNRLYAQNPLMWVNHLQGQILTLNLLKFLFRLQAMAPMSEKITSQDNEYMERNMYLSTDF